MTELSTALTYSQWLRSFSEIMQKQLTDFEKEQVEEYSGSLEHGQAPYEASESGIYEDDSCYMCLVLDLASCMPERLVRDAMLDRHGIPYQFESRLRRTILELERTHGKRFEQLLNDYEDLPGTGSNEKRIGWLLMQAQEVEDAGTDEELDPNYVEYYPEDYEDTEQYFDEDEEDEDEEDEDDA